MDDAADTGGAERAFEALQAEVAALRQAVEGQAAPDYALTLGAIVKLQAVGARLSAIEASPQLQATAATVAQQMRQEAGRLAESQVALARAAQKSYERGQQTLAHVASVEQRAQRDRRMVWAVGGGGHWSERFSAVCCSWKSTGMRRMVGGGPPAGQPG
jgi:hypothetical protein